MTGELRAAVDAALSEAGRDWLTGALARVAGQPSHIRSAFPVAGRRCGRGILGGGRDLRGWTLDDGARALLLIALPYPPGQLTSEVTYLYESGDAAERRGVLRALALLPVGSAALPLVQDALRSNDSRLICAALGPYGARHLDDHGYRQAVLKCVFTGIRLSDVYGIPERADPELDRMLMDYARERAAAGRDIPPDVWTITAAHRPHGVY